MTDILKSNDRLIPLDQLPPELQEKIKKYAVLDIYKDKAKKEIKAVKRDQEKTIPAINQTEYTKIINELKTRTG